MNSNTTAARRTWSLSIPVRTEGAWLMTLTCTVTALRLGNEIIAAFIDGVEASIDRVNNLIAWAKADGTLQLLEAVDAAEPVTLTKRQAQALHLDLSRLGYTNVAHYEVASAAIAREVASLTELTSSEAQAVWQHACLVRGYSTPVSRYYGQAAA